MDETCVLVLSQRHDERFQKKNQHMRQRDIAGWRVWQIHYLLKQSETMFLSMNMQFIIATIASIAPVLVEKIKKQKIK